MVRVVGVPEEGMEWRVIVPRPGLAPIDHGKIILEPEGEINGVVLCGAHLLALLRIVSSSSPIGLAGQASYTELARANEVARSSQPNL